MGIIKDDFLKEEKAKAEAKQKSKYEEALSKYNTDIDDKAVQEAVRKIITEKVHQNDTMEVKKFLMGSIELPQDHRLRHQRHGLHRPCQRLRRAVS